ncbi:MAG: RNA pseudouridine synthase [Bacteroidaceae bacterium]|nr:RNA pseudouridine synthase [Bacteroidaceae bacterium]
MNVLYEDNHIIVVNKQSGEIVQGDKTGDVPLSDILKAYLKEKYNKPGNVYLGVVHRLDRPVTGAVLFAKTSKALPRLNKLFAEHEKVKKTYWAIVPNQPSVSENEHQPSALSPQPSAFSSQPSAISHQPSVRLTHWLTRNEKTNTAKAYDHEVPNSKKAILDFRLISTGDRYALLEIQLHTGRHHQIRCQLSKIGCPIKGDLKYGAPRSNPDGSICLHARKLELEHPVTHELLTITAPVPKDPLWQALAPGF